MVKNQSSYSFNELSSATNGNWKNLTSDISKSEVKSVITDSRSNCRHSLFLALEGDKFDGHNFIKQAIEQNASALCVNKDKYKYLNIPSDIPVLLVKNTLTAYQKIATHNRLRLENITIIALTGSNGKTSTKDILLNILTSEFGSDKVYATKANTNNHIGVPLNLLSINKNHRFAIIEMGSNHPGEIAILASIAKPDIAAITSIGPSHLEFFKDLHGVAKEKSAIFSCFNKNKKNNAIIPSDCPEHDYIVSLIPANIPITTFGSTTNSDIKLTYKSSNLSSSNFSLKWKNDDNNYLVKSKLVGAHQASNATAAASIAHSIGISRKNIIKHLLNASVEGMRMKISIHNKITWINDAYNSNPLSTKAGIDYISEIDNSTEIKNDIYIILGNMLELGKKTINEHISILEYACRLPSNVTICCVGNIMNEAAIKLSNSRINSFGNNLEVINYLKKTIQPTNIVYLKGSRGAKLEEIEKKSANNTAFDSSK